MCQLYKEAQQLRMQGVRIVSTDEMTGIQAIERAYPTEAMTLGDVERVEFEYIRHGTRASNCVLGCSSWTSAGSLTLVQLVMPVILRLTSLT